MVFFLSFLKIFSAHFSAKGISCSACPSLPFFASFFCFFCHFAPKYLPACARSGCVCPCSQSLSQSVSQPSLGTTAARRVRAGRPLVVVVAGKRHLESGIPNPPRPLLCERSCPSHDRFSLLRKFCYAAANLQQLP